MISLTEGNDRRERLAERLRKCIEQKAGYLDSLGIAELEKMADAYICRKCRDVNRKDCPLDGTSLRKPCCSACWLDTEPAVETGFFRRVYRTCAALKMESL